MRGATVALVLALLVATGPAMAGDVLSPDYRPDPALVRCMEMPAGKGQNACVERWRRSTSSAPRRKVTGTSAPSATDRIQVEEVVRERLDKRDDAVRFCGSTWGRDGAGAVSGCVGRLTD